MKGYLAELEIQFTSELKGKKEIFKITDAQKTFFKMFPFTFLKGNPKTALKDNTSIVFSEEAAVRLFGTINVLGKEVTYSGRKLIVRGVYNIPGKSSMAPEVVTSLINARMEGDKDNCTRLRPMWAKSIMDQQFRFGIE